MSSETMFIANFGFTVMVVFLGVVIIYSILEKFGIKIHPIIMFGSFGITAILGLMWIADKINHTFF